MWILSVDAGTLLSVVQFDPKKAPDMAKSHGALDGDYLLVRARVKQSLEYVRDVLAALYADEEGVEPIKIETDKTADYHYRTVVTRDEWKRYLCFEADGIDYSSHVKEETVARQPEPKIGNLYSALSATWTAWSKLQPAPPYAGKWSNYGWQRRPDCKNCGHAEIKHSYKGDKCDFGKLWKAGKFQEEKPGSGCTCTNYEPKDPPQTALPSGPTPKTVGVGESAPDPEYAPLKIDYSLEVDNMTDDQLVDLEAEMGEHDEYCGFRWYEACDCGVTAEKLEAQDDEALAENEYPSLLASMEAQSDPQGPPAIQQEPAVKGESKRQRKARQARNRRARRQAQRAQHQVG